MKVGLICTFKIPLHISKPSTVETVQENKVHCDGASQFSKNGAPQYRKLPLRRGQKSKNKNVQQKSTK